MCPFFLSSIPGSTAPMQFITPCSQNTNFDILKFSLKQKTSLSTRLWGITTEVKRVFPRLAPATCTCVKFSLVQCNVYCVMISDCKNLGVGFTILKRLFSSYLVPLFQRVLMQNLSCENKFDLYENELVGGTHLNCFTPRLVLIQRQQGIQK